jgi:hypothetical protein
VDAQSIHTLAVELREGDGLSGAVRMAAVGVLCLLAAFSPFVAGRSTAAAGILPLSCAIWLVVRSRWSVTARVVGSVAVVAATVALLIGLLAVALTHFNN